MSQNSAHELHRLAEAAGVARFWRDVDGNTQCVKNRNLEAILTALGHDTSSQRTIDAAIAERAECQRRLPPMIVTQAGMPTTLPITAAKAEMTDEAGTTLPLTIDGNVLAPVHASGYYVLALDGQTVNLAVAPAHCPLPQPAGRRRWGTSIQIPALRSAKAHPFGGFADLADAAECLAQRGCDAIAINPVHALFPGIGDDFSPYSPSSRISFNGAMGDPALLGLPPLPERLGEALIDWPNALPLRLADLRASFAALSAEQRAAIAQASQDASMHSHAVFDALFCHFHAKGAKDWREWPSAYHVSENAAVKAFAREHPEEIAFHGYTQWLAREGLAEAQRRARASGMSIGIIADLAVGVHLGGSDSWAMADTMLQGLTIGAPPDPLGPHGQNWTLTSFSPDGLRETGFAPWITMLRSAMRSAGGLRIDHAFGLARLWVIPEGCGSDQGAYLHYPFIDMVRLLTLEADRASAIVIAEDLGTSPPGFTHAVSDRHMLGMRVLWFERAEDHGYVGAHDYPRNSVAMTGTHDTPTVAGWWTGNDLDWAQRLGRLPSGMSREKAEEIRDWDRGLLWSTIAPGGKGQQRPAPDQPDDAVLAALAHVASSPALLSIAPMEDLLADTQQPNLPGTIADHPNWRRRLPAPMDALLDDPKTAERVKALTRPQDAGS